MAVITIPDEPTSASFTVGSTPTTGPWSFSFRYFEKADLEVLVDGVSVGQSGFAVTGNAVDGGFVGGDFTLSAEVSSTTVEIRRNITPTRTENFSPAAYVSMQDLDVGMNRLVAIAQDTGAKVDRVITAYDGGLVPSDVVVSPFGELLVAEPDADSARSRLGISLAAHYETRAAVQAATPDAAVNILVVLGCFAAGDGGLANYKAVGSEPSHEAKLQTADLRWWENADSLINVKSLSAKGDGVTDDATAINNATAAAVALGRAVYFPPGSYAVATGLQINLPGTRWIADEGAESSRWNDTRALTEILYTGTSTSADIVTIGGAAGNGFQISTYYNIERVKIANLNIRAATAGKGRDGIRIDGGNDVVGNRGFARDIELRNVSTEDMGGCGFNLRGNVFDVHMWAPIARGMRGSGFKCDAAATVATGVNRPGEVWLHGSYSRPEADYATFGLIWSYELVTGYTTLIGGKGQGSNGIYAGTNTQFSSFQMEESSASKSAGSIAVQIAGRQVQGDLTSIAGYETAVKIGDGANLGDGYQVRVGEIANCTKGLWFTSGATRVGLISVGNFTTVTTPVTDNRTTSLLPFETIYETNWTHGSYDFRAPSVSVVHRYAQPPVAQEVNTGDTIAVGGSATIELTTAEAADFTLGSTPIADGVPGEELTLVNRSGKAITFPNGSKFATAKGVNQALGTSQAMKVVFSANLGRWIELGSH